MTLPIRISLVATACAALLVTFMPSGPAFSQEAECRNRINKFMEHYEANKDAFTEEEQKRIADLESLARNKCSNWKGERFLNQEAQMIMGRIAMAEEMKQRDAEMQGMMAQQRNILRQTYNVAMLSVHEVLEGVSAYGMARAENDEYNMRRAAASTLGALAEAQIWVALLDDQVTAEEFGTEADQAVSDLHTMLVTTYDNLDEAFFSNDLTAINERLDSSADRLNRLFLNINAIAGAVGPKIAGAQ